MKPKIHKPELATSINITALIFIAIYTIYDKNFAYLLIPAAATLAALIIYIKHKKHQHQQIIDENSTENPTNNQEPPTPTPTTPTHQNMPYGNNGNTQPQKQQTFEEKITQKLDHLLDIAQEKIELNITIPIDQTINYHGKEVQLTGTYTLKIDNTPKPQQTPTPTTQPTTTTPTEPIYTEKPVSD
ncbi:MAG: hypothetical protein WC325_13525 [Candidatus Bathyarchaeia archaeon]|jgi:Ca2+/Na+ antiporter